MRKLIALTLLVGSLAAVRMAASVPMPPQIDFITDNCSEFVPEAVHVPVVEIGNNKEDQVFLDVYLVGDRGVTASQANKVLVDAREAYDPLNVRLRNVGFRSVNFTGTDAQGVINQTKDLFPGGQRPNGSDVVWTLTTVDLTAPGLGNLVAGLADCIGGVRWADRSFVVGEWSAYDGFGIAPVWFYGNLDAKVFAHETGHILGAHHHYANCAQGLTSEVGPSRVEGSPCTLMTNFADFISINFGVVEGLTVRAHAEEWARP